MIKYIGKKLGMIELYNKEGDLIPVTVIKIIPTTITFIQNFKKLKIQKKKTPTHHAFPADNSNHKLQK